MQENDRKYIFITGGVLSGLGKGLVSASIAKLLQPNYQITPVKCDGYLNVDPGTMNPSEHGEVYVLADGTEVDMDFGHYERFLNIETTGSQNLTSGKIFQKVIQKERNGDYLGETVQMIPHVTEQIQKAINKPANKQKSDIIIIEVGGTVGDIENMLYLETLRQIQRENPENTFHIHVTLVPHLKTVGEQKTKPTQHSVKKLRETGLQPDMIITRNEQDLENQAKEKISLFTNVPENYVISNPDQETIYNIPIKFQKQKVAEKISKQLNLEKPKENNLKEWKKHVKQLKKEPEQEIAICGKYTEMDDTYASIEEALKHAAAHQETNIKTTYIDTSKENYQPEKELEQYDGIIIPGGFGTRGVEGKIETAKYARKNNKPLLGLCYGMQIMAIEYARNKLNIKNAASAEFQYENSTDIIDELPSQKNLDKMGGTMRLGNQKAKLTGQIQQIYGKKEVKERHRHRYELKPEYAEKLHKNGLKITGKNTQNQLPEYLEKPEHPFYIGTQAHPEFNSSLQKPNPLYNDFVETLQKNHGNQQG